MHAHRLVLTALLVAFAGCAAPATPPMGADGSLGGRGTSVGLRGPSPSRRRRGDGCVAHDGELPGAPSVTKGERLAMARIPKHDPATLAARLRARRLALELTRARVAELAGVAGATCRRFEEQGQRPGDPARRAAIARILQTGVDELLGRQPGEERPSGAVRPSRAMIDGTRRSVAASRRVIAESRELLDQARGLVRRAVAGHQEEEMRSRGEPWPSGGRPE
jgi:transcriptional regulator with XRE-family HTH domain